MDQSICSSEAPISASASVVTGTVDDVRPYLERVEVVMAPYWMGGGVKHKIPHRVFNGQARRRNA
jgi:hypothetical protein